MTEFKQDNFTFVDVVSLIFLVILFIGNFFGLLYFTSGNFPISIAISALVVVLYYAIIQLLKKSKQKMVTQRYKSPATILLVLFVVLAIFSFVPLTHLINIETKLTPFLIYMPTALRLICRTLRVSLLINCALM